MTATSTTHGIANENARSTTSLTMPGRLVRRLVGLEVTILLIGALVVSL